MKTNKITVILGTAHLKSTPGKCSPDKKFYEYKYSREICKAIKTILEDLGYNVMIDIEDDDLKVNQSQELCLRCKVVNEMQKIYKNCIYVSIHVNAAGADGKWHNATGWSAYTSVGITAADRLATCLYDAAKTNL
jgi:N-acetylmuramoyl-L-alanine amidase